MRFRTLAIAAALSAGLSAGFAPFKGAERPLVSAGQTPRSHRDIRWRAPVAALATLPSSDRWRVMWDHDTDVPVRLWGPAIPAPGTSGDAGTAEAFARAQLDWHLALLAPGAATSDFTLLANTVDAAGLRTVAFAQQHKGLAVTGGTVAFTFSHDKLTMISSTALPNVSVRMPTSALAPDVIAAGARNWLASAGFKIDIKAFGGRVVMPIVRARGNRSHVDIEYRVAELVEAEAVGATGAWRIWVDAHDGSPIARASTLHFATGSVLYDVPDRYPGGTRGGKPAPEVTHIVNAMSITSAPDGSVTWAGDTAATVVPGLTGPLVKVSNRGGTIATDSLTLDPDGSVTWSKATDEYGDAQLISFVAASTAKQFVRERLNPQLAWLNSQIPVSVNENDVCNAYSTGNAIHFYKAGSTSGISCENTGRITDVVYHEFGHSVHNNSVIPGEGDFESALSEGLADTLAASITGDHGMGRGFFKTNAPLRDLDPANFEKRWPDDTTGEPHDDGEIIGGTLWDLRTALETNLGAEEGFNQFLKIYYGVMQRAADIPTSYAAALVTDDDDGDLSNGTPNICAIDATFAAHGLADPAVSLGLQPPHRDGLTIGLTLKPRDVDFGCERTTITKGTLAWKVQGGQAGGTLDLAATGADGMDFSATIPTQPDGTIVRYAVTIELSNGSQIVYPQNPADPTYQVYIGATKALWCSDFEAGIGEWTTNASVTGRDEWEVGMPLGIAGDPSAAHGGTNVLGIDLGNDDGIYRARTTQYAESPAIDLQGYTNVHLQYYRWLTVEDGVYDEATIIANDDIVWNNFTSPNQNTNGLSHTDKEWRFHDVDLTNQATNASPDLGGAGTLKVRFQLSSDEGLELGGWNVDDVCIVATAAPAGTCDPTFDPTCDPSEDGGCCSAGSKPTSGLVLSLLTLGFLFGRRRRRR